MRRTRHVLGAVSALALVLAGTAPVMGAATTPVATWEMNEPAGATTMLDSSGNGIDGTIGSAVQTGLVDGDATGYRWVFTQPNAAPAKPERLVVADDSRLNPGTGDFAVTVRFRTTQNFGNIIQKGQSTNRSGMFKWQIPKGKLACVFRGLDEQGNLLAKSVNSGLTPLNDGNWHTVTCERTSDRVTMTIDGTTTRRALGATGRIDNTEPLTIGGKGNCDQITITCDYFTGEIDYVRISNGDGAGGGGEVDTTAPTVTGTTPAADAIGVKRGSNMLASFSEAVTGVDATTMRLTETASGTEIGSAVNYIAWSKTAKLNPEILLLPNTQYTVTMDGAIADAAGNTLAPTTWSFTTVG